MIDVRLGAGELDGMRLEELAVALAGVGPLLARPERGRCEVRRPKSSVLDFVNLVEDPELWWQVASDTSHVWGGWKYLKQVQWRLEADRSLDPEGRKSSALRSIL